MKLATSDYAITKNKSNSINDSFLGGVIRTIQKDDINSLVEIWLTSNIKAHSFIKENYWLSFVDSIREMLLQAEIYLYENKDRSEILGFIGLNDTYIEGIFVKETARSYGIGKALLDYVKTLKQQLKLAVYQKNTRAVKFYQRESFGIIEEHLDANTNEKEYIMLWDQPKQQHKENISQHIIVTQYNPDYEQMFKQEACAIKKILGDNCLVIHHIGSTSVPKLAAKPIIDIMPVVKNLSAVDQVAKEFEKIGYEYMGEFGIVGRRYLRKGGLERTHHIHIFNEHNTYDIQRHLAVRDYLRTHQEVADAYGALKIKLANEFPYDIDGYCAGKDAFVKELELEAIQWKQTSNVAKK